MKQKRKEETDAIHELEGKRKRLKKTDVSTSKELYEKCEKSGELSLVTKATRCWWLEVPELSMPITWPNKRNNRR